MPEETAKSSTVATKTAPPNARPVRRSAGFKRRTYGHRRKVCRLCAEKIMHIDYKQFQILRTFTADSGKMLSSRITGTCAKHQRQVARAVKRNRNIAMLPYVSS